jgi:hypothetical protein
MRHYNLKKRINYRSDFHIIFVDRHCWAIKWLTGQYVDWDGVARALSPHYAGYFNSRSTAYHFIMGELITNSLELKRLYKSFNLGTL